MVIDTSPTKLASRRELASEPFVFFGEIEWWCRCPACRGAVTSESQRQVTELTA